MQGIKEILKEVGHSRKVAQLARETGIDPERIYKWIKRGVSDIKASDAEKILKWANMDKSPTPREAVNDKYLSLLENNDQFFKNLVNSSLIKMAGVQSVVIAHLKAIIQESAEEKAAGDRKERERLMKAWDKRIAANLGLTEKMDIGVGGGR